MQIISPAYICFISRMRIAYPKRKCYISVILISTTVFTFCHILRQSSEYFKINQHAEQYPVEVTEIPSYFRSRKELIDNGCRKILNENRLRSSYVVPENFVTIRR